jgi:hypothetical protein
MRKLAISQSNYIPWKGYFDLIRQADIFVLYDSVQYTRRDWRNRNRIIGSDKNLIWLSIPVQTKGKYLSPINEIEVADQEWRNQHFETLYHCYRRATYFREIIGVFEELYFSNFEVKLSFINRNFIKKICELLRIETTIEDGLPYSASASANEKLLMECDRFEATTYLSGPSAASYLNIDEFKKQDIDIEWISYDNYPEYNQNSLTFEHKVSIVDLLFNHGPHARNYLLKI